MINPLREAHKSESETLKVDDFRGTSWGRRNMSWALENGLEIGKMAFPLEEISSAKGWRRIHRLWMESNVR